MLRLKVDFPRFLFFVPFGFEDLANQIRFSTKYRQEGGRAKKNCRYLSPSVGEFLSGRGGWVAPNLKMGFFPLARLSARLDGCNAFCSLQGHI